MVLVALFVDFQWSVNISLSQNEHPRGTGYYRCGYVLAPLIGPSFQYIK